MLKYSLYNQKVGDTVILSRPVGDTCPTSCYFLNNGCYAQKTEHRWPNTRKYTEGNVFASAEQLKSMFLHAKSLGLDVRLFERGDFLLNGELDIRFVDAIITALSEIEPPNIWVYTHVYDSRILKLEQYNVAVYASIHNRDQYREAKKQGFKLFALNDTQRKFTGDGNAPKFVRTYGEKFIVCPEQISNKSVTCCGTKDSLACKYCVTGKGNVLFVEH